MNLQQLIELSVLDAMGLLDDVERGEFESAFRAAAPAVQAQVRREQTRLSVIESLLPDVAPPAGMRSVVLDAVRRQILADRVASDADAPEPFSLPMLRPAGVSRLWRAAAFGLAAAALVLAVAGLEVFNRYNDLVREVQRDGTVAALEGRFGPQYVRDVLFSRDTKRVVFSPAAEGFKGQISAFFHPEWKDAKLFHFGLEENSGRVYKIAVIDENDNVVQVLKTFSPDGSIDGVRFSLPQTKQANSKLAVLRAGDGGRDVVVERGDLPTGSL